MVNDAIKIGEYIIIQKQNYKKLHKLNKPNSSIILGRDNINLSGIDGCPYYSVFKIIPSNKKGREYRLELTDEPVELIDEIDIKTSGSDNRDIVDDGRSQKLSKEDIDQLTNHSSKASDIVGTLISHSNTFHNKTEYSQEKYLKKKEKKYFEYLQILKPNVRIIAEIMYKIDPSKINNLRIDTLSQIITLSNIHCEGNHLLYDSGSNGLLAAALLSAIGSNTNGKLILMHPGNLSQKQALLAMNFSEEQSNRCISVNIYSVLRQCYQGNDTNLKDFETNSTKKNSVNIIDESLETKCDINPLKRKANDDDDHKHKVPKQNDVSKNISTGDSKDISMDGPKLEIKKEVSVESDKECPGIISSTVNKINSEDNKQPEPKKPKWHYDNLMAAELLQQNMDSLVIACKEDPQNILMELLPFIKPGRPFVIYYSVAEPLQNLYVALRSHANVAALKLTCNWMRNYQVLPERTHPDVMMSGQSGFLLTGYVLK